MHANGIDVLVVTHRAPEYARLTLETLLAGADDAMRVWIWHNGDHAPTLESARSFASHPRVVRFHHSPENQGIRVPTNWLWANAEGEFVSKVDDDCLLPAGWAQTLMRAHRDVPRFGVLGCWRFHDEDFVPDAASRKIQGFEAHRVLRNFWVEGTGYVMKRQCIAENGVLAEGQSFPNYCIQLSLRGWINGWYFPFLRQEHMDDPRSPHTRIRSDADLCERLPLSAQVNGVTTLAAWQAQLKRSAHIAQTASIDPRDYRGWRRAARSAARRLRRLVGIKRQW